MSYLESLNEIKKARQQRDKTAEDLYKLQMKYIALEREYKGEANEDLKQRINHVKAVKKENIQAVNGLANHLYVELTPQQLIEEWRDDMPITLLPVRMETKYRETANGTQLMVRIYPDDIAIVTHEKTLTQTELDFGRKHWELLFNKEGNAQTKREAWKLLTDKFGINRAAWVAKETIPVNWDERDTMSSAEELSFSETIDTKPDSWTEAAHTRVLPDRFVLTGYRNGKEVFTQIGSQVKDIVIAGPAPIVDENDPSFTRDETDNRIQYGEDYAWVADFNIAVQEGLGFVIQQSKEDVALGYDQLLVLGLKLSADENDSKQLLEDLIENHRYSLEGMSLLKQGTPTNNTESEDAGYQNQQSIDDMMLQVETGQQLFTPTNTSNKATDGQRLAEYLGLDYSIFQTVQNSQISDHAEAMAMNTALHPGTLGYFTSSMLNGVFSDTNKDLLRRHFINYVSGRGPLPAIRVGNQPYGIIVTSDFDSWLYPRHRYESINNVQSKGSGFYQKMYQLLQYMTANWKGKIAGLPQITKDGDAGASLLKILGLNPGSVEFFQRVGYSYDHLSAQEQLAWKTKYVMDLMMKNIESARITQLLTSLGYSTKNNDGSLKTPPELLGIVFQHYHTALDKKNIVDTAPLSEENGIKPFATDGNLNYIDWLINNAASEASLESQNFGNGKMPKSLLFMMLKNGLLVETNHTIFRYLATKNINASELVRSRKFMNISTSPSVSPWEIYKTPVNLLVSNETSNKTLFNHVHTALLDTQVTINLEENKAALNTLKDLPTARLQRAFIEHLDTLSYRLDAWQTSLFDQRISAQRNLSAGIENRKTGVYLGSYGYLENVKMRNTRKKIEESILPEGLQEQEDNLYIEKENGGFVHAPSLNHATAAAILRNGYLTHADKDDAEALSVNLSSERVRSAKAILEGITNGQTLEALLGYQFERGLHDWSTRKTAPVILNQLKPDFRKSFPIKKTKVPQEGKTTGPEEITEEFTVVNGLTLANVSSDFPGSFPYLQGLNALQLQALNQEKKQLQNTLDAVKDLLTAESAYQMASGNFDRAAAVMQAVSSGNIPPDVEVINTARSTQMTFTNRIVLHLDVTETNSSWPLATVSLKAKTEPALNNWIGKLLGAPEDILCSVTAVDTDGNILLKPDLTQYKGTVSLADLLLQPLDFILLIRNELETTGASELESRIRQFFLVQQSLGDDIIIKIQFADTGSADLSKKSFAEILPYANYLRQLISNSKPLQARDFVSTSEIESVAGDNPGNIDWNELKNRAAYIYNQTINLVQNLKDAIAALEIASNTINISALRISLRALADAGFTFAFPGSVTDVNDEATNLLLEQGKAVVLRFADTENAYTAKLLKINAADTSIDQKVSLLTDLIKSFLGEDFTVLPRYNFNNPAEIQTAATAANQLLTYAKKPSVPAPGESPGLNMTFPVAEFLHSASLVRPKMHTLEMVRLLHENFNDQELNAQPMQLPYKVNDSWLSVEFPKDTELLHDTIAYLQYTPQDFDPNAQQCGLLFDEWTETIPNPEEVSGITFNYNQPNSTPPQAILLAVTPAETGNWNWQDLTNTILDTFERAKQRAIEPDDIDKMPGLTTLLPATMAEFSVNGFTNISLDYSMNILLKFLEVQILETKP